MPTTRLITFQCPCCKGEWHARLVHDDAVPLPLESHVLSGQQA